MTTVALSCFLGQRPAFAVSESEQRWVKLQRTGSQALDANQFWIAEPMLKQALAQAETLGLDDIRLAKSLGELGHLYTIRGRFLLAESYLERELLVKETALGAGNSQIVPAMGSLIRFYLNYGSTYKADPLTEEMLAIVEGKLKEPSNQGQAKLTLKKGMPLDAWAGLAAPPMHDQLIEWAIACDEVGNAHLARRNFDLAERLFKAALDLKATVLGKQHMSLANSYDSLGSLCLAKKENGEAELYFRDALSITEKTLPPESAEVYSRLDKLAKCLIKSRKYEQAEQLYLRALHFWKDKPSKYGEDARALYALGSLYVDETKYEAAAPVLQKALKKSEQYNGPLSVGLVPYLQRYAYALYHLGRRSEVLALRTRANAISGDVAPNAVQLRAVAKCLTIKKSREGKKSSKTRKSHKITKSHKIKKNLKIRKSLKSRSK